VKTYFWNVLTSLDQMVNTVLGPLLNLIFQVDGFGYPDETISSVLGKHRDKCKLCRLVCGFIDKIDPKRNHCVRSIELDEGESEKDEHEDGMGV